MNFVVGLSREDNFTRAAAKHTRDDIRDNLGNQKQIDELRYPEKISEYNLFEKITPLNNELREEKCKRIFYLSDFHYFPKIF